MGLKCRLLGHTYGEPEVERNREEQGDEVVVTIREIQACERCGDEQVVSQNKEVTAIRSPEEVGLDGDAGSESGDAAAAADAAPQDAADGEAAEQPTVTPAESTADPAGADEGATADATPEASEAESTAADAASASAPAADDGGVIDEAEAETGGASDGWETGSDDWEDVEPDGDADDAVILDDAETERDETQWPGETDTDPQRAARESAAREEGAAGAEPDADDEVTNDAEIIDADDGQSDAGASADASADADTGRERGEWAGRDAGSASNGWPDHEGEDEGYAATPGADADVEFDSGGGLTPEVNGHADADDDAETIEGIAAGADDAGAAAERNAGVRPEAASEGEEGFARAGESTTLESDVPDDRVEFYCPNCGHSRVAGASSMRAGDICPECKQGYIAERER